MLNMTGLIDILKEVNPVDPYETENYKDSCFYANHYFMLMPIEDAKKHMNNVTDIENKLYKFLKNQHVIMGVGLCNYYTLPCPSFVTADAGYKAVIIPEEEMHEEANQRLMKIAHEIGHFLDLKVNYKYNADAFKPNGFKEQMTSEIMAWHYGEMLLEALEFDAWDEFEELKYECLLSYADGDPEVLDAFLDEEFFIINQHESEHTLIPC